MDPLVFLTTNDPILVSLMARIAREYHERLKDEQKAFAEQIIVALGKALKKP